VDKQCQDTSRLFDLFNKKYHEEDHDEVIRMFKTHLGLAANREAYNKVFNAVDVKINGLLSWGEIGSAISVLNSDDINFRINQLIKNRINNELKKNSILIDGEEIAKLITEAFKDKSVDEIESCVGYLCSRALYIIPTEGILKNILKMCLARQVFPLLDLAMSEQRREVRENLHTLKSSQLFGNTAQISLYKEIFYARDGVLERCRYSLGEIRYISKDYIDTIHSLKELVKSRIDLQEQWKAFRNEIVKGQKRLKITKTPELKLIKDEQLINEVKNFKNYQYLTEELDKMIELIDLIKTDPQDFKIETLCDEMSARFDSQKNLFENLEQKITNLDSMELSDKFFALLEVRKAFIVFSNVDKIRLLLFKELTKEPAAL